MLLGRGRMQNRNGVRLPAWQSLGALKNPHGACAKTALDSLLSRAAATPLSSAHTQTVSASSFCQSLLSFVLAPARHQSTRITSACPIYCLLSSPLFLSALLHFVPSHSSAWYCSRRVVDLHFPRLVQIRLREPLRKPRLPRLAAAFKARPSA